MTLIFGVGEVRLSNTGKVSLDSVQNAWETEQERYNNNLNFNIHCLGSEKLLNILERLHSIVCKKYSIYEGLNDLSGLIDKAARLWVPEKKNHTAAMDVLVSHAGLDQAQQQLQTKIVELKKFANFSVVRTHTKYKEC